MLRSYYKGGEYDFLLNSDKEMDLLNKRFIVFELDAIRDHKILFPVVTIIIMETFTAKLFRLKNERKVLLIEEAWKAISKAGMQKYNIQIIILMCRQEWFRLRIRPFGKDTQCAAGRQVRRLRFQPGLTASAEKPATSVVIAFACKGTEHAKPTGEA